MTITSGASFCKRLLHFRRADFLRLVHGDARRQGGFLNRRRKDFVSTAARAVRLRNYCGDLKIRLSEEMFERGYGELGSAAEDYAHREKAAARAAALHITTRLAS